MLKWFRKDPLESLRREYANLLEQARDLQRNGDIRGYAARMSEAEEVLQKIDALEAAQA